MSAHDVPPWKQRLAASVLVGLLTSTFSTVVVSLGAARIGRDAAVDWMVVASLVLRDDAFAARPSWGTIATGILVHQSADLLWAIVFFTLLGRIAARLSPAALVLLAAPWAALTSTLEWTLLVPLWPFRQPVFTLEQVVWLGFATHLASSSLYPLFPWLQDRLGGVRPSAHRNFAAAWSGWAAGGAALLGVIALLGALDHELPHLHHAARGTDADYMRRMAAHHEQGVLIATLAETRANDPHLRALARLMHAAQRGEIDVLAHWWRSWFHEPAAFVCTEQERAAMPGMLSAAQLQALREMRGPAFDARFVEWMSLHHRGAILMADEQLHRTGDPRLALMSHAIRHEQRGEIGLMQGLEGAAAVRAAAQAMVARAGEHPADGPVPWPPGPAAGSGQP